MSEFQAVIMAGGQGSRMYPLTEKIPKALLPVGNIPLICYPVHLLEKAGFEEVIICTLETAVPQVTQALTTHFEGKIKFDVIGIPDEDTGTADTLRFIKDKIEEDLLVLSCDLISDLSLHYIADVHRTHDATITAFFSSIPETSVDREAAANPKIKKKKDNTSQRDFLGLDSKENRILFFASEADLEETLDVRRSILKSYPCINVETNLMDAHLYIIKRWVIDFLAENRSINTIKGELIPYFVKKQFQKPHKLKEKTEDDQDTDLKSLAESTSNKTDIHSFIKDEEFADLTRTLSTWSTKIADSNYGNHIKCHACIMKDVFCLRANNVAMYMEANRQIPKIVSTVAKEMPLVHPSAIIKPKSQVGQDCMVADCVSVGERVSVKKSIIGKHSTIADKAKISNSVIMDHVTIKEGCNIQGSIVCNDAYIKENVSLKDCQVGVSCTVAEGADVKGEAIADEMMDF